MSAKPDYVVNTLTRPTGATATGGYVINLTSSTTPMALSQPKDPTLAQFTFFVSRRLEDGRERFRLHMGYFETMQAAEEMLAVVREVYPQRLGRRSSRQETASEQCRRCRRRRRARAPPRLLPSPRRRVARCACRRACPPPPAPVAAAPQARRSARHRIRSRPRRRRRRSRSSKSRSCSADDDTEFKPIDVPVVHPPAHAGS